MTMKVSSGNCISPACLRKETGRRQAGDWVSSTVMKVIISDESQGRKRWRQGKGRRGSGKVSAQVHVLNALNLIVLSLTSVPAGRIAWSYSNNTMSQHNR